jgi:hypothetical protein
VVDSATITYVLHYYANQVAILPPKTLEADSLMISEFLRLVKELRGRKLVSWKPHEEELVHYNAMFIMNRLKNIGVPYLHDNYTSKNVENWWGSDCKNIIKC